MTYSQTDGQVVLYVDGKRNGQGTLKPRAPRDADDHRVQIGYAAGDFPEKQRYFHGRIADAGFYRRALSGDEIAALDRAGADARWVLEPSNSELVRDETGHGHDGTSITAAAVVEARETLLASVSPQVPGAEWQTTPEKNLRLKIPAGPAPLKLTLRLTRAGNPSAVATLTALLDKGDEALDLGPVTRGGSPRGGGTVTTSRHTIGRDDRPFAVDDLAIPDKNPWLCRIRPTGFDFDADGRRAFVCTWRWRRLGASGRSRTNRWR